MKISSSSRAKLLGLGAVAIVAALSVDPAMAGGSGNFNANGKTLGTLANNLTTSIKGFGPLATAICYVSALMLGIAGGFKLKAYGEQPDRTPLKSVIVLWGVAVVLAAFPEFMGTGIVSLWGANANTVAEP